MRPISPGWAGPVWGLPSQAALARVPLGSQGSADRAAYRADGGASEDFAVLAASVRGVSHRLSGRRCEDSWGWAMPVEGRLAVVLADGVGSAGQGGRGADLAVGAACRYLGSLPVPSGWGEAECLGALGAADGELAQRGGPEAAQLATTLVVALLGAGPGGMVASLARIGDSTAFRLPAGPGPTWEELFEVPGSPGGDDTGTLSSTATFALPLREGDGSSPAPGGRMPGTETVSVALAVGDVLVLASDGVADPLRDGPTTVAPGLAALLCGGPGAGLAPLALAEAIDFSRRGAHDDRSVVAVWPLAVPDRAEAI